MKRLVAIVFLGMAGLWSAPLAAQDWGLGSERDLSAWFLEQTNRLTADQDLTVYRSVADWERDKPQLRRQLFSMMGLDPLPEKTELHAAVTGAQELRELGVMVEKLHFQSRPGLYVTANLYRPTAVEEPLPAVLYVCGHGRVVKDGVSYGNKTHYHHHGVWFARSGYVCLMIDTLQLGEIEGLHHGTFREGRWWWTERGYTPAGVEAWNCIRALDYLETRGDVDASRFGVTGRSGGGAYSWWIAALDERIRAAVPVAGVTSMQDHIVRGCIEGHCDCMFFLNAEGWDFATMAALVAPRPLLISNTDKDRIFPLSGVIDVHRQVRHIYELYQQPTHLGLHITEGPHKDTQELRVHAFRWMNRWLKKDESLLPFPAEKFLEPEQLRVFAELPADQRNTEIDREFVAEHPGLLTDPQQQVLLQSDASAWGDQVLTQLKETSLRGWPGGTLTAAGAADVLDQIRYSEVPVPEAQRAAHNGRLLTKRLSFESEVFVPLTLDIWGSLSEEESRGCELIVLDAEAADRYHQCLETGEAAELPEGVRTALAAGHPVAVFMPRGCGRHQWDLSEQRRVHIRRRMALLGRPLDTLRAWDIVCARRVLERASENSVWFSSNHPQSWTLLVAQVAGGFGKQDSPIRLCAPDSDTTAFLNLARVMSREDLLALGLLSSPIQVDDAVRQLSAAFHDLTEQGNWPGHSLVAE